MPTFSGDEHRFDPQGPDHRAGDGSGGSRDGRRDGSGPAASGPFGPPPGGPTHGPAGPAIHSDAHPMTHPMGPASATAVEERPRPDRHRWAQLAATAAIAAVVACGTTVAVTHDEPAAAAGDTTTSAPAADSPTSVPTPLAGQSWTKIAAQASPAVVAISVTSDQAGGEGSGVVWDAQGDIVTNNHVVTGAGPDAKIEVRVGAQKSYPAKVVGTDPTTDLAVIRLTDPPSNLTPIARAGAGSLQVGDPVMALGNPLGLAGTVTTGIVSALDRPVTTQISSTEQNRPSAYSPDTNSSGEVVTAAIQTSAAINPGNSGGALVDGAGRLVGINSSIAQLSSGSSFGGGQQESGNIGIGFAIPVGEVTTIVDQLISSGHAQHATVGIGVTDAQVTSEGATVSGAGIRSVTPSSPAATAGLSAGTVVTAVDGRPVDSADGLVGRIRGMAVGQKVTLTVLDRSGTSRDVAVTLGAGAR